MAPRAAPEVPSFNTPQHASARFNAPEQSGQLRVQASYAELAQPFRRETCGRERCPLLSGGRRRWSDRSRLGHRRGCASAPAEVKHRDDWSSLGHAHARRQRTALSIAFSLHRIYFRRRRRHGGAAGCRPAVVGPHARERTGDSCTSGQPEWTVMLFYTARAASNQQAPQAEQHQPPIGLLRGCK